MPDTRCQMQDTNSWLLLGMRSQLTLMFWMLVLPVMEGQVTGLWRSTDHTSDTERSVVRIYEERGKLYGRVEKLLPAATVTHCTGCDGDLKNKSLVGIVILLDLEKAANGGINGKILDPSNGKYYSCDIELEGPDRLKVRGYMGLYALGTTMYWHRER